MHTSSSAASDGAIPELDEPPARPTRGPPPGMAGDPAEAMLRLVQDRDRIAEGMNDIVVTRLYSAGLSLETALGLMGDQPGAGQVQNALGQLDLAIQDSRSVVFDHHQPDSPNGGQPLQGVRRAGRTYTTEPMRYPI